MTLQELLENIRQAHIPEAETQVLDFLLDIKNGLSPV